MIPTDGNCALPLQIFLKKKNTTPNVVRSYFEWFGSWSLLPFRNDPRCTCGLSLGNVVSMLFIIRPQTDSFACTRKLDLRHILPIYPWPRAPSIVPTQQLSSKSQRWARHISDNTVTHNNVDNQKQSCLIVSTEGLKNKTDLQQSGVYTPG